jgi:hypothetical protein
MKSDLRYCSIALFVLCAVSAVAAEPDAASVDRQSLEDAWWTGPILAASAATLPQGHFLVEPYVYDVITTGRFDTDGDHRDSDDVNSFGSLTYINYGLTDLVTIGVIPTFGFNDVPGGADSSGIGLGDISVQAQYRLTQFREGGWVPTTSIVLMQSLPTGKHDRLGDRPSDGLGSGAHVTTLAWYSMHYLWMPNGRIMRTRLNVARSFADDAAVSDVSVYGTPEGFRGHARPGDSWVINSSWEYSATRNWVLALDLVYQHNESTSVRGSIPDPANPAARIDFRADSGSGWQFGIVPAIEYNFTSTVGVIVGARWFAAGRNASAGITPVAAINMVF